MRVPSSLPYSGIGLMLFTAIGMALPAQQVKRAAPSQDTTKEKVAVAPARTTLHPIQVQWQELVELQASLPRATRAPEQAQESTGIRASGSDVEDITLPDPVGGQHNGYVRSEPSPSVGGVERLGNCSGFMGIPPASLSTAGQGDGPDGGAILYYPPNAAGGVGPNHLMVMAPNTTLVQDRFGATVSSMDTLTFWSPTGATPVRWCRLNYDGVSGRWLATTRGGTGIGGTSILFAISDSDDPTGGWDYYSIPGDPDNLTFADNLNQGYNQTWVVVTAEMYSATVAGGNKGSRVYTFDMAGALAGGPVTANTFGRDYVFVATSQGNADVNWRNVPTRSLDGSVADIHLLNTRLATSTKPIMQMLKITGTGVAPMIVPGITGSGFGPDPSTSSLFFLQADYTNSRQVVLQIGDVRGIDPIPPDGSFASTRARLSDAVVRNGKIFMVQNHGLPAPAAQPATQNGLSFYELDPAGAINQTTFVGPFNQQAQVTDGINTSLVYPSLSVNCAEDVLIGFTRADLTRDLEAAYCMRLGTDAPGSMGPITTLKAGESSWWQVNPAPNAGGLGAWGYYSSTAIDPNDNTTMWTLQPYAATRVGGADADSRWGTWWGRLGDCEIRPVITSQPVGDSGCIGDMFTFTVAATTGSNPLQYQWRKDGVDIPGANSDSYTIASAVSSDQGSYDCVVCSCGLEISDAAILDLGEPTIVTQPADYFAKTGEPAAFFVVATPSLGNLNYQWFKGNTPVGTNSDIFIIQSVVYADFGEYHVVVTDGCGPAVSNTVELKPIPKDNHVGQAEPKLQIIDHPVSTFGCVGGQAVFSVTAAPKDATYEWRFNGVPIMPAQTSSTLVIDPVSLADDGIYDVVVSKGTKSKTSLPAALTVADVPLITVQPSPASQSLPPGSNVLYSVTATSTAPLHYQWQKRPNTPFAPFADMPQQTSNQLGLPDIATSDGGTYRCRISNLCGFVISAAVRLIVL